jgi:nucleotide-binding universal stress UspA family protein
MSSLNPQKDSDLPGVPIGINGCERATRMTGVIMRVLIAYDGSVYAEVAIADLDRAGLPPDTDARVLTVIDTQLQGPVADVTLDHECIALQHRFGSWSVEMETAAGNPAEMILKRARDWSADLIVIGTHGRSGLARLVLGSVSTEVTRDAPCSVRIARPGEPRYEGGIRLLVGMDGSPEADVAVNEICRRHWPAGTQVRVLSVIHTLVSTRADEMAGVADSVRNINAEEHRWLDYLADESERKLAGAGLVVSSSMIDRDPKEALINEARHLNADAIFVGARGIGRVERFLLGSVSAAVITHAPCTVEVVRRH